MNRIGEPEVFVLLLVEAQLEKQGPAEAMGQETVLYVCSVRQSGAERNRVGKGNEALSERLRLQEGTIEYEVIQVKNQQANVPQHL